MANKEVTVRISATDAASPVFRKIGAESRAMGTQIDQSAQAGARSLDRINKGAAAMGAAIGGATLLLGEWSRAAAQDEANQARLQQAVENTGKAYDDYSEAIDRAIKAGQAKAFSDDDTREALVRLNAVTNDTGQSLEQLGLVMDFARARGISLADSAGIIAKVMGGNVSILQRYGLAIEDGATATEALAMVQQRSAGQASTYANTQIGQLDKMKDKWGELAESIGGSTGELQSFLLLLPGLSAGATALAGLVAGMGGIGAVSSGLLKYGGPLAIAAGGASLAYGYSQDTIGTTQTNEFWNNFFKQSAGIFNALTPGSIMDTQKYDEQMASNQIGDALIAIFGGSGNEAVARANAALNNPAFSVGNGTNVFNFDEDDLKKYVGEAAARAGVTVGEYLLTAAKASDSLILDPVTGTYKTTSEFRSATRFRSDAIQAGATSYSGSPGTSGLANGVPIPRSDPYNGMGIYNPFYRDLAFGSTQAGGNQVVEPKYAAYASGGSGAIANSLSGIGAAPIVLSDANQAKADIANAEAMTAALREQYGAYAGVVEGINSASDATSAFKAVQDGLLGEQDVYNQQIGEYTSQLSAQDAAYAILEERQANGIALTKEQIDFMGQYAHATEVGTGAVEDATIEAGLLAQQYLLNKETGDAMNATLNGTNEVLGTLAEALTAYILTLQGVPAEVRTELILNNDPALASLYEFMGLVPSSITIPMYVSGQQVLDFMGGGAKDGTTMSAYAGGGTVYGGNHALVGERGPEVVWLPNGSQVMNTEGSKSRMKSAGGNGGGITLNGPVYIYPATGDVGREFTSAIVGDWRN